MAAVEQRIEYKRELHAGDLVTIRSTVLEVNQKSIRMMHEMTDDETGQVVASTMIIGVYLQGLVRKARPLPEDVRERATLMITDELVGVLSTPPDMRPVAAQLRMPAQLVNGL